MIGQPKRRNCPSWALWETGLKDEGARIWEDPVVCPQLFHLGVREPCNAPTLVALSSLCQKHTIKTFPSPGLRENTPFCSFGLNLMVICSVQRALCQGRERRGQWHGVRIHCHTAMTDIIRTNRNLNAACIIHSIIVSVLNFLGVIMEFLVMQENAPCSGRHILKMKFYEVYNLLSYDSGMYQTFVGETYVCLTNVSH